MAYFEHISMPATFLSAVAISLSANMPYPANAGPAASSDTKSDPLAIQREEIDLIETMAERTCNIISFSGSTSSSEVEGKMRVELSGLAKHLAEVGASGSATINSKHYAGVLQEQLASTITDNAACKLKLVAMVQDKLLQPVQRGGTPLQKLPSSVPRVQSKLSSASRTLEMQHDASPRSTALIVPLDHVAIGGIQLGGDAALVRQQFKLSEKEIGDRLEAYKFVKFEFGGDLEAMSGTLAFLYEAQDHGTVIELSEHVEYEADDCVQSELANRIKSETERLWPNQTSSGATSDNYYEHHESNGVKTLLRLNLARPDEKHVQPYCEIFVVYELSKFF